jgi:hypothetical protein
MMVKISKMFTRPDESIPWHFEILDISSFMEQFDKTHAENCISNDLINIDPLNIKIVKVWVSDEACQAYQKDSVVVEFCNSRDEYNNVMGIVAHATVKEFL